MSAAVKSLSTVRRQRRHSTVSRLQFSLSFDDEKETDAVERVFYIEERRRKKRRGILQTGSE